jgi:hypothetical protein
MHLCRKFAPLLNAAIGALALMVPVPAADAGIAELSPLRPVIMLASVDVAGSDDAAMASLRAQASTAMIRLQDAAKR